MIILCLQNMFVRIKCYRRIPSLLYCDKLNLAISRLCDPLGLVLSILSTLDSWYYGVLRVRGYWLAVPFYRRWRCQSVSVSGYLRG